MNDENIILNLAEELAPQAIEKIRAEKTIVIPDLIGKDFFSIKNKLQHRDVHGDYLSEKVAEILIRYLKKEFNHLNFKYFKRWGKAGEIRIVD